MIQPKMKYIGISISIVLVLGIIAGFVMWSHSPNKGRILTPQPAKGPSTYNDKKLVGTYMSFQYSGKYIVRNEAATNGDLERYTLSADTHYDKRILASVANLPDGKLESNGAYIFRQKSSNIYTSRKVTVDEGTVNVWVKNDGTEQTAMLPHGDKVAVVSLITAGTSDDLNTEMDALLKTFQWKQ